MGTHKNARKRTGAYGSAQERQIMSNKGHREIPINTQMSKHLPSSQHGLSLRPEILILIYGRFFGSNLSF